MLPIDDLDERLRRAAMADGNAVDRVVSAALSDTGHARRVSRLVAIAVVVLACAVAVGAWSLWRTRPRPTRGAGGDEIIWLTAPDGTTWIFAGPSGEMLPPGSCVVIAAGGSQ